MQPSTEPVTCCGDESPCFLCPELPSAEREQNLRDDLANLHASMDRIESRCGHHKHPTERTGIERHYAMLFAQWLARATRIEKELGL